MLQIVGRYDATAHSVWLLSAASLRATVFTHLQDLRRSSMSLQVIHIQSAAPPKPALGAPCNGCGVCCLVEPCPVGVLLSGRRTGACAALRWDHTMSQYRCGAITQPKSVTELAFPVFLSAMAPLLSGSLSQVLTRFGPRWIAAGKGCDCSLQVASQSEP